MELQVGVASELRAVWWGTLSLTCGVGTNSGWLVSELHCSAPSVFQLITPPPRQMGALPVGWVSLLSYCGFHLNFLVFFPHRDSTSLSIVIHYSPFLFYKVPVYLFCFFFISVEINRIKIYHPFLIDYICTVLVSVWTFCFHFYVFRRILIW